MSKLRVIIIDDDTALLQALPQSIALRMQGLQIDTSDSGFKALQMVQQYPYEAVVSDIKMPGMDGISLIQQLKILRPDIPILLITGHGERDLAIQALRAGAYDFIQKPIDRDYFISSLQRAIQACQMRRQVAEQRQTLEHYTHRLERMVDERTKELKEANASKDVFMGMVSHELKSPLTTLKGITQMLYRRIKQDQQVELKHLDLLKGSVSRMELLVNDLLNTSLLETCSFSLHRQPSDFVALCQDVLTEYREGTGVTLDITIPTQELIVDIDRERMSQVILNLLSNAYKYAPKGSPITVTVECQQNQAILSITDRGVGIPPDKLTHIFERFYRIPEIDSQVGSRSGVGLGLYIVQRITERHGGSITATSVVGQGSTFTLRLPLQCVSEQTLESTYSPTSSTNHASSVDQ